MKLSLSTLPERAGRRTKRIGRGHGSGRGTYAGRGMKGQRARTGGKKGLGKRSSKQLISHLPKRRGFRSTTPKYRTVSLRFLERQYAAGDTVSPATLAARGCAHTTAHRGVKILGTGVLTKKLTVQAHAFSATAERAILQAGGTVVRLS